MTSVWPLLEQHLADVEKPARYIGLELGAQRPEHGPGRVSWLLAYPDTYEIGLPNQGLQILYEILNERDDAVAERAYAPWGDLEAVMRRERIPLFSVDTHRAAGDFDVLAFNLSAELTYTNLLNCVDLAGVPVRAADRRPEHPLVAAGGHCTYNPEPLADFVDFVVLGRRRGGRLRDHRGARPTGRRRAAPSGSRAAVLRELARVDGRVRPVDVRGRLRGARHPGDPAPLPGRARAGREAHHRRPGRVALPRATSSCPSPRWCTTGSTSRSSGAARRGCRFCQAGMITRPVRERPAEQVRTMVTEGLRRTGYDEVALTSLSTADFSGIESVVQGIVDDPSTCGQVSVSLPSLRVDAFTVGIAAQIQKARRTGLTFAPEAGTWRMRQIINKLIREEDLYGAVDERLQPGLAAGQALLPDRAALGDRRGHARHPTSWPGNCVDIGRTLHQGRLGQGVGGRLRAQAVHALPVVRAEHGRRAAPQDRAAARRHAAQQGPAAHVARPQGHPGRGAGLARATAASAR